MSEQQATAGAEIFRRQSLEAVIHRACPQCGAPAHFLSHESIRDGWPECYVPPTDMRLGQLVGDVCPCCGVPRPRPEDKGEIWWQAWVGRLLGKLTSRGEPV